jgi:hypothetical protein
MEVSEKNGDICGHRVQEVASLQGLTRRVTLRFNVWTEEKQDGLIYWCTAELIM